MHLSRNIFFRIPAALLLVFLGLIVIRENQANLEMRERELVHEVLLDARAISELVAAANTLDVGLLAYQFDQVALGYIQQKFDILWSRHADKGMMLINPTSDLAQVIDRMGRFLAATDPLVFGEQPLPKVRIPGLRMELDAIILELRAKWAQEFGARGQDAWLAKDPQVQRQSEIVKALVWGLILIGGIYLVMEIVLARRAAQREAEMRQTADAANKAKSDFVGVVSHEIRTPLNGILGMAAVLAQKTMPQDQRRCVDVIEKSGALLLSTINDLLDLAKVEAGCAVFDMSPVRIDDVVFDAVALHRVQALQKALVIETKTDEMPVLLTDQRRLKQVINNLLNNAIKFTEAGKITVEARYSNQRLQLCVEDTGPGIAKEDQERIFEPFGQSAVTAGHEIGTGLGLPICREICRHMGGDVILTGGAEGGARFCVDLPLQIAPDMPEGVHPFDRGETLRLIG